MGNRNKFAILEMRIKIPNCKFFILIKKWFLQDIYNKIIEKIFIKVYKIKTKYNKIIKMKFNWIHQKF